MKTHIQTKTIMGTIALTLLLFINSCKDKAPRPNDTPSDETELITTVILAFEDSATSAKSSAIFRDADGPGGNPPGRFDTIHLATNHTYFTKVILLDESKNPADTISNEVLEEADEHLFVFMPSGVNIRVKIEDSDANQLPLGLNSRWWTGLSSAGKIGIILKHQPGVKDGTSAPGETDVDVDFHCMIQ